MHTHSRSRHRDFYGRDFTDPRGRGEGGVALGMRWVMRVRRVRSDEEGRAEREHERSREEPHLRDSPEKGGHRIVSSRCP